MLGHVTLQRAGMSKVLTTDAAAKRLLASVNAHVNPKVARLCERAVAYVTAPRTLVQMQRPLVPHQLAAVFKPLWALGARMRSRVDVDRLDVRVQCPGQLERLSALRTLVLARPASVHRHDVRLEDGRLLVRLAAVVADVRPHLGVRPLVVVARRRLAETFPAARKAAGGRTCTTVGDRVCRQQLSKAKLSVAHGAHKLWRLQLPIFRHGVQRPRFISGRSDLVHTLKMFRK